ncbi:MAG: UDP-N-acetylmuramoyl-tripeptide--D-alanyl-D-alanine ligase [Bacteroidetes bacterium]|nr:UDP-N-acetylmuramoyl-tripeptide--D-alanyl-D-alanine ligase [Bacteroidota bacterium]
MKRITLRDFQKLTNVELFCPETLKGKKITGVSTDSRSLQEGNIFFALHGETFDAHNFIKEIVEKKPSVIVVEKTWGEKNVEYVRSLKCMTAAVPETTRAYGDLARLYRRKFTIPVLAIGGSNGKTTTKEMITAVLRKKYKTLATEGNLNNHIGVPQTLFRLQPDDEFAVVEVGTNHFGELQYLCEILEPTHALLTNIGKEHLEFFKDLDGVAQEETVLFRWVRKNKGFVFINSDDPYLEKEKKYSKKFLSYGTTVKAEIRAKKITVNEKGQSNFLIEYKKKKFPVTLQAPGKHNVVNALAASAVGLKAKVPPKKISEALQNFTSANKRMQILTHGGYTILNDTYNSNPDSVLAALQTLAAFKANGKKIVVLADMKELGEASKREHTNIGVLASEMGFEWLFTFGHLSVYTHEAFTGIHKMHFQTKTELLVELQRVVKNFDVLLIKGSRGMKMEEVVLQLTMQNL